MRMEPTPMMAPRTSPPKSIFAGVSSMGVTYASCAAHVSEAEPGLLAAIRDAVGIRVTAFRRRLASRIHLRRHRYLIVGLWTLLQVDHGTRCSQARETRRVILPSIVELWAASDHRC